MLDLQLQHLAPNYLSTRSSASAAHDPEMCVAPVTAGLSLFLRHPCPCSNVRRGAVSSCCVVVLCRRAVSSSGLPSSSSRRRCLLNSIKLTPSAELCSSVAVRPPFRCPDTSGVSASQLASCCSEVVCWLGMRRLSSLHISLLAFLCFPVSVYVCACVRAYGSLFELLLVLGTGV